MIYGLENMLTTILFLVGLVIVIVAQTKINNSYKTYKSIKTSKGLTGQEIARKILDENGLKDIYVVEVRGELTDHYDPGRKVVRLSKHVFHEDSIAAVAVAAHEVGHAIQDKEGYFFMKLRSFLVFPVNFITYVGYIVAIISLLGGATGYLKVSIFMILAALLFQLVTLPVEFDASKRAKEQLVKLGLVDDEAEVGVESMLSAAALTYVASFVQTLIQLMRLVIMLNRNKD